MSKHPSTDRDRNNIYRPGTEQVKVEHTVKRTVRRFGGVGDDKDIIEIAVSCRVGFDFSKIQAKQNQY